MTPLAALWLPILLTTLFVFIASSLLHTVIPWHKSDLARIPDEDTFRRAVGPMQIPPGDYATPYCDSATDMGSEEFKQKLVEGPLLVMTVRPNGPTGMATMFITWTLAILAVTLIVACVAGSVLPAGSAPRAIWHLTAPIAFVAYGFGTWPTSIWFGRKWSSALKDTVDAVIYAAITAATFGWMWPGA